MRLAATLALLTQGPPPPDTLPRPLDPVVVTAERAPSRVGRTAAAVTRLEAAALSRAPSATVADLLRMVPGLSFVDFDGLGFDPQLMTRGFYGGGEAEYVVVEIDGRPVNQLQTGLVAWDALPPLSAIEAVEVVRGGVSSLYGDAAIGGVINIITRSQESSTPRFQGQIRVGSFGTVHGEADLEAPVSGRRFSLSVAADHTAGFRDHAERTTLRGRSRLRLLEGEAGDLAVTAWAHSRHFDEPGPLLEDLAAELRDGSDLLFRFDHTTDREAGLRFDARHRVSPGIDLRATLDGGARLVAANRTLALAPGFGDTKARRALTRQARLNIQAEAGDTPIPGPDRLIVGIEAGRGTLDSQYFEVTGGTREDYATASGARGALDTRAGSARGSAALYLESIVQPVPAVRLSVGARVDAEHDRFTPRAPAGALSQSTTHHAVSPKAGINLRYLETDRSSGTLYASASRSFKAPTLDQLYDQRNIPVPFPPFQIRTSNPELRPQHGTNLEAGTYFSRGVGKAARVTASGSLYQITMRDELDFSVETFRYVNLGGSRHRGVEAGLAVDGPRVSAFASYALQAAVSRSGAFAGNYLKAIPRHTIAAGVTWRPVNRMELGVFGTHQEGVFLDDANTVPLPGHTRVDAQASLRLRGMAVTFGVRNVLDRHFNGTGFLDPAGSGAAYLYPAAGRVIELGLRG